MNNNFNDNNLKSNTNASEAVENPSSSPLTDNNVLKVNHQSVEKILNIYDYLPIKGDLQHETTFQIAENATNLKNAYWLQGNLQRSNTKYKFDDKNMKFILKNGIVEYELKVNDADSFIEDFPQNKIGDIIEKKASEGKKLNNNGKLTDPTANKSKNIPNELRKEEDYKHSPSLNNKHVRNNFGPEKLISCRKLDSELITENQFPIPQNDKNIRNVISSPNKIKNHDKPMRIDDENVKSLPYVSDDSLQNLNENAKQNHYLYAEVLNENIWKKESFENQQIGVKTDLSVNNVEQSSKADDEEHNFVPKLKITKNGNNYSISLVKKYKNGRKAIQKKEDNIFECDHKFKNNENKIGAEKQLFEEQPDSFENPIKFKSSTNKVFDDNEYKKTHKNLIISSDNQKIQNHATTCGIIDSTSKQKYYKNQDCKTADMISNKSELNHSDENLSTTDKKTNIFMGYNQEIIENKAKLMKDVSLSAESTFVNKKDFNIFNYQNIENLPVQSSDEFNNLYITDLKLQESEKVYVNNIAEKNSKVFDMSETEKKSHTSLTNSKKYSEKNNNVVFQKEKNFQYELQEANDHYHHNNHLDFYDKKFFSSVSSFDNLLDTKVSTIGNQCINKKTNSTYTEFYNHNSNKNYFCNNKFDMNKKNMQFGEIENNHTNLIEQNTHSTMDIKLDLELDHHKIDNTIIKHNILKNINCIYDGFNNIYSGNQNMQCNNNNFNFFANENSCSGYTNTKITEKDSHETFLNLNDSNFGLRCSKNVCENDSVPQNLFLEATIGEKIQNANNIKNTNNFGFSEYESFFINKNQPNNSLGSFNNLNHFLQKHSSQSYGATNKLPSNKNITEHDYHHQDILERNQINYQSCFSTNSFEKRTPESNAFETIAAKNLDNKHGYSNFNYISSTKFDNLHKEKIQNKNIFDENKDKCISTNILDLNTDDDINCEFFLGATNILDDNFTLNQEKNKRDVSENLIHTSYNSILNSESNNCIQNSNVTNLFGKNKAENDLCNQADTLYRENWIEKNSHTKNGFDRNNNHIESLMKGFYCNRNYQNQHTGETICDKNMQKIAYHLETINDQSKEEENFSKRIKNHYTDANFQHSHSINENNIHLNNLSEKQTLINHCNSNLSHFSNFYHSNKNDFSENQSSYQNTENIYAIKTHTNSPKFKHAKRENVLHYTHLNQNIRNDINNMQHELNTGNSFNQNIIYNTNTNSTIVDENKDFKSFHILYSNFQNQDVYVKQALNNFKNTSKKTPFNIFFPENNPRSTYVEQENGNLNFLNLQKFSDKNNCESYNMNTLNYNFPINISDKFLPTNMNHTHNNNNFYPSQSDDFFVNKNIINDVLNLENNSSKILIAGTADQYYTSQSPCINYHNNENLNDLQYSNNDFIEQEKTLESVSGNTVSCTEKLEKEKNSENMKRKKSKKSEKAVNKKKKYFLNIYTRLKGYSIDTINLEEEIFVSKITIQSTSKEFKHEIIAFNNKFSIKTKICDEFYPILHNIFMYSLLFNTFLSEKNLYDLSLIYKEKFEMLKELYILYILPYEQFYRKNHTVYVYTIVEKKLEENENAVN
ncbi:hypothetical protein EDEG_00907 [Edhazardia aedis USNM 41457]|uniref:Uncharacterized protein n=1 Tax=Edhazardia aedis (strain USNM 41457) TaxID=1003232 RepID=J9DQY7_EDHAE|nr:hypothetical protein EDEG_00907 [Edhazardia aedis USNM 41457]|eukprot:EJW04990.1 hypothetical protein EDEG_00907 [Edhazardia aedis USNM 41457]